MPERPLLLFPTPDVASRSTLGGGGDRVRSVMVKNIVK